jgi:Family of unknown function (DUF5336)
VNFRSLTRGDGAVIGAAVLLLIASFLPFYSFENCDGSGCTVSSWHTAVLPVLPTVHLAALLAAALFFAARTQPEDRKVLGLGLRQWGVAVALFAGWSAVWSMFSELWFEPKGSGDTFSGLNDKTDLGYGAWLTLVLALAVAVLAVLSERNPALKAALIGAPKPAQPQSYSQPYTPGPGQPGGGYGYPGGGQPQPYGGQPQQPGSPIGGLTPAPATGGAPQPGTPTAEFAPFWFAVPVARPLYSEDGSPSPIAELTPGTWYLAVDQRGPALVAQTQDGRRGVLQDTTGIQRG